MGLDISAFSKLTFECPYPQTEEEWESYDADAGNLVRLWPNDDFPGRDDGLQKGLYKAEPDGQSFGFRAGSYGSYNRWREMLCQFAFDCRPGIVWGHPDQFEGKPFFELIHFADNEGTIGPKTSAKLAADFDTYAEKAKEVFKYSEYELYECWQKAFHIAADDGAVSFH